MSSTKSPSPSEAVDIPRLELRGICKSFPGTLANDHVSLSLMPGEIHALLGENGAGKSTLVKIVYGVLRADEGEILWQGEPIQIASPAQARRLGIGMVFQHFSLFDSLTVAENIALGIDEKVPMGELTGRIGAVSAHYGLALNPGRHVHTLSVGERQRVEIVRCLLQDPRLLIMDEPTSVLTPQEAEKLFETLRRLADGGCSILYISHKLEEIRALCSKATVMRGGRVVATCDPRTETARGLAQMMIGAELSSPERGRIVERGEEILRVAHLSVPSDHPFGVALKDIDFSVHGGEIFGIAGVAGNGQPELLTILSGERPVDDAGSIVINGKPVGHLGPRDRRKAGMAFVPEERLERGAVPEMTLAENSFLSSYAYGAAGLLSRGLIRVGRTHTLAGRIIDDFNVVAGGSRAEARSLSGGNLQKFIIGREMLQQPNLLIAAHPTWGVDAGAAASIHQALIDLAKSGSAVLIISQDLDELFAISDRLSVVYHGRLSESRPTGEITVEQAGLLMGGMFDETAETVGDHVSEA
ncbi:MAG: ABC transporter ATP-binding protein [Rhodospirillales bacterium]|nr:ABC transporter ATP-binding protein [Rhodospirillales bacterium]